MDAANRAAGQTAAQFLIESLDILRRKPGQLLIAQTGPDVVLNVTAVVPQRVGPQSIRHIFQPLVEPLAQGHPALLRQVGPLAAVDVLAELRGQLFLCRSVDIPEDRVAVFFVAHHDAALPATVIASPHHAVARRSALRHLLLTSSPNITVVFIHALGHQPDTQSEAQDEILGCCDTVDLML